MSRKWLRPLDVLIAVAIIALTFLLRFCVQSRPLGDQAEIYVGGTLYETVSLDGTPREYTIETEAGVMRLSVTAEGISVTHADCPDQLCVRTGHIAKEGESIVCAPLGVSVTVGKPMYDGVTG